MTLSQLFSSGIVLENRYRIKRYLAEGGFGAVFSADQEVMGHKVRQVALKVTKATRIDSIQAGKILIDAIILAHAMEELHDHNAKRHLVRIYDMGVLKDFEQRGFIVMEFISGKPLSSKMRFRMPESTCLRYVKQICTALAALHSLQKPIIHRDLKPDNVLVEEATDDVRIVDFGLAAQFERIYGFIEGQAGTEGYMAPETSVRSESSCASDVYSVGVIMYQMLTGQHPFTKLIPKPGLSEEQKRLWINEEKRRNMPAPPSHMNNTISKALDQIVLKCLSYYEHERFRNAAELLKALPGNEPGADDSPPSEPPVVVTTAEQQLQQGCQYMQQQAWKQAEQLFREGLREGLKSPAPIKNEVQFDLLLNLGLVLIEQNDSSAVEQIEQALRFNKVKGILTSRKAHADLYGKIADAFERNGKAWQAITYRNEQKKFM